VTPDLLAFVRTELARPVPPPIQALAEALADKAGAEAVLFYGSSLRTGDLTGVLDFYVLTRQPPDGLFERWLWPRVGYRQLSIDGRELRAKVATLSFAAFRRAAAGQALDTTIWARFVQPAALVFARGRDAREAVVAAVAAAAETAARYAAALGPARGSAEHYWAALFRRTYRAEFRVEKPGREREILGFQRERYAALLPLAWASGGVTFDRDGDDLAPALGPPERKRLRRAWRRRQSAGKPLNIVRLMKAAFTFEGAAQYAAWKIERHTGVAVPVTPFRERHPILAAPGVLLRLWGARRRGGRQPDAR
jgi:hypothetical protein